jgi:hypothetical protein
MRPTRLLNVNSFQCPESEVHLKKQAVILSSPIRRDQLPLN